MANAIDLDLVTIIDDPRMPSGSVVSLNLETWKMVQRTPQEISRINRNMRRRVRRRESAEHRDYRNRMCNLVDRNQSYNCYWTNVH